MTTVWFTSDLHIGHELVARERTKGWVLPRYVGAEIDAHDRILAEKWDAVVQPDDQVWVLGDISAGGTQAQKKALAWLRGRPGEKHLVPGNHDGCHPMYRDSHKWQAAYLQVFRSVQPFARRRIGGRDTLLSHLPYLGDHTTAQRFNQYRLRDEGVWLLHGHTHSRFINEPKVHPRQLHVGVDAWHMAPVLIDRLADLIDVVECADAEHG
ncbi:metallophosphoesterase [Mycobacteroides abscessus]|uniref:metallophosphoesterase n=1 Tax=Mycobacteroides abscessus TaxID=36809 RepID=UPI0009A7ED6E|nr:metallophosphoesterase [Mycobacteroides abscessus]SKF80163.1 serine/threonine specific protein phosphatase [Mycobacteroides abscessus subsp. bolletii]SKG59490.1 serine/threonine specific protein phosphatase [Mycobacteroides abscessus subsp. bolletii]SKG80607.1 serine/threonine specific protein phosphatase [Mycobacteroides abscessus subsp. bolletii]SKG96947.1 serine/threonine specific protein phosphatase [Mycobacteroides abscessus subsp. bolletii]SKH23547.1 serine/threonine specific protein 